MRPFLSLFFFFLFLFNPPPLSRSIRGRPLRLSRFFVPPSRGLYSLLFFFQPTPFPLSSLSLSLSSLHWTFLPSSSSSLCLAKRRGRGERERGGGSPTLLESHIFCVAPKAPQGKSTKFFRNKKTRNRKKWNLHPKSCSLKCVIL